MYFVLRTYTDNTDKTTFCIGPVHWRLHGWTAPPLLAVSRFRQMKVGLKTVQVKIKISAVREKVQKTKVVWPKAVKHNKQYLYHCYIFYNS